MDKDIVLTNHNINITGNYTIYDNDIIIDIHFTPYNNMVKIVNK